MRGRGVWEKSGEQTSDMVSSSSTLQFDGLKLLLPWKPRRAVQSGWDVCSPLSHLSCWSLVHTGWI